MEKKLIQYFKWFQLSDLLGFARILGVEEKEDFEDFVVEIVLAFNKQNRTRKRQLLRLAKDIVGNNKDYDRIQQEKS